MPVTRSKSVGNTSALTSRLGIIRILEAIFTCVAFSLVAHEGYTLRDHQNYGDWCMFAWCFCFAITIIILVVEFVGLQHRVPVSWRNFPITFAMYATLLCLSASIIFPVAYLQKAYPASREQRGYRIAATVFSCLACLAYSTEVTMTKAKPGEVTGYMATVPGLLKVVETFIACIIFVFLNRIDYEREDALKWCLAVYCICFILSLVVIILCIGECTGWLPCAFNTFLSAYTLLAVLMYATATVIWPIYHFDRKHGGTPDRYCSGSQFCDWDKYVTIAVLTALNLLVYLADLVYSARLIFIQG